MRSGLSQHGSVIDVVGPDGDRRTSVQYRRELIGMSDRDGPGTGQTPNNHYPDPVIKALCRDCDGLFYPGPSRNRSIGTSETSS